jgi:hypothetical protein
MRVRPVRASGPALLLAFALTASGCGPGPASSAPSSAPSIAPSSVASAASAAPSSGPSASAEATFAAIESQVEAIRGLTASTPVRPVLLDPSGLADKLTAIDTAQTDHVALADESRLFVDLGLLPAGSSLEKLEIDLDAGQVVGFYDPDSKGLYVLSASGGVGPIERATFSHEFTHALQDQAFGLAKLATDTPDQGDRDLARIALPEGDATLVMTEWSARNLSMLDLLGMAGQALDPTQAKQLADAPAILRQDLTFPYDQGLAFVQGAYAAGGWDAVNRLYARPPASTSQILHPELYASDVEPVTVSLPTVPTSLGSGWKLTMQDTIGEFQLGVWLEGEQPTAAQTSAATAATSTWAGDRVGLYEGPNGAWVVVMRTQWRDTAGAGRFQAAADQRLTGTPNPASECGDDTHEDIIIASDQTNIPAFSACKTGS